MLYALTPLPVALSSNASGWSKALEIFIIVIGILALIVTVYLMWKHKAFSAPSDAAEEGVIRTGATSTTTGALYAFVSVMGLPLSMAWVFDSGEHTISLYSLFGPLCAILALMNIYAGITDRLEYDESGIRQYWALRNKSIQWSGLENVEYKRFTRTLKLSGGGAKVYVELRNPNAPRLLKFMAGRVTGENRNTVEELLHGKPNDKSV